MYKAPTYRDKDAIKRVIWVILAIATALATYLALFAFPKGTVGPETYLPLDPSIENIDRLPLEKVNELPWVDYLDIYPSNENDRPEPRVEAED